MKEKKCEYCGKNYSEETFSSCPYCNSQASEESKNAKDNKMNMSNVIDHNPGNKKSLKVELIMSIVVIIAIIGVLVIGGIWGLISGYFYLDSSFKYSISPGLFIIIIFGLFVLGGLIYSIHRYRKLKSLIRGGMIIKKLKYTILTKNISKDANPTSHVRIKVNYIADNGSEHEFYGTVPLYALTGDQTCDVLVDQSDYNKYIVMDIID